MQSCCTCSRLSPATACVPICLRRLMTGASPIHVGYGYYDLVKEVAERLGQIVEEPGEITLIDHDAAPADYDEAKTTLLFGPSDEAIKAYVAKRDIEAGLGLIAPHVPAATLDALRALVQGAA